MEGHSNKTWDELREGDEASVERKVAERDIVLFSHASGNLNPMHMPGVDVDGDGRSDTVAPSMWLGSLVSAVLGNLLPGAGTLLVSQNFEFGERARVGDTLRVSVRVVEKHDRPRAVLDTRVTLADGRVVAQGRAEVIAPTHRVVTNESDRPALLMDEHEHFERLIDIAASLPSLPTAVVWPDDPNSLRGTLLSMRRGLITPVLIGSRARLEAAAAECGEQLGDVLVIDAPDHDAAAMKAVQLVHSGEVRAIMKGNVHSDELLAHVVKKDGGLRAGRRISHVFVLDVPTLDHPLFVSDAAINIAPDLPTKADIVQSAIDLARACGVPQPRVAVLSAVETVNVSIPSSMDAAILAKMADRGQITGGLVDGPLAMDNAIDAAAARSKKIVSQVAGAAQVLIVPNLEAGNMLAKQLTFVSRAQPAGLVVGARVPVMLTSRADNDHARLASCAVAILYEHWRREGESAVTAPDETENRP
ncbi:bifunctional enoyl-CoA hydratase/phosphate acetyltransferase [Caballeronia novacaledonica]|uniref:Bifunctional enoyl-CoA hydratase/phosphate acetyltransferase n=1 Tax=Caballeronia novacaledonica TaxID=1544861 RepID=A0A2U3I105_9BURK|nr:bifunctional enoyl-CoA hydratase/phosphate acetyltransferase [Caballeronia novacaledonica]SPB13762.1 bifunctional enoyl-CoA hydratase/phosphate acetyltransferase [Caballeronia novacaledonica]